MHTPMTRPMRLALPCLAAALVASALIATLPGCATRSAESHPHKNYILEYRQMTADAAAAIRTTLQALDAVMASTNTPPQPAAERFADQVNRLEVDSIKVRARSQAMLARGDAYFEQWHHHLAHIQDPEIRAMAEQRHPQLQESFTRVKQLSAQTRDHFQPLKSDLRKIRGLLEADPNAATNPANNDLLQTTRREGSLVDQDLAALLDELDKAEALVKPLRQH